MSETILVYVQEGNVFVSSLGVYGESSTHDKASAFKSHKMFAAVMIPVLAIIITGG